MKKILSVVVLVAFVVTASFAQAKPKFSYAAQKKFIPAEFGQVYLGMPMKDFAARIDLTKADINDRFGWLEIEVPFAKGNVTGLAIRVHGLSTEEMEAMLHLVTAKKKGENGEEYDAEVKRLKPGIALPAKGFVYAMYVGFKQDFDLKKYVNTIFGPGEVRKPDEPHFFDTQWTKKTPDGLTWLIRAFHEGDMRSLQLLGRIDGTEWDPGV